MSKRVIDYATAVMLLAGAGIVVDKLWLRDGGRTTEGTGGGSGNVASASRLPAADFADMASTGTWVGPPDAIVILVVYSNYGCGYCGQLNESLKVMRARYPQHLAIVWKHFDSATIGNRYRLSVGSECASEQNRFQAFHNTAFEDDVDRMTPEKLRRLARIANVPNLRRFEECMHSGRQLRRIRSDRAEADRLEIRATPTMFVNGSRVVGAAPLQVLDSIIAVHFPDRGHS